MTELRTTAGGSAPLPAVTSSRLNALAPSFVPTLSVRGILPPTPSPYCPLSIWIYFETWPSWMAVPLQYPTLCRHVHLFSPSSDCRQLLAPLLPSTWCWSSDVPPWGTSSTDTLCLIQGSPLFLATVPWRTLLSPMILAEDASVSRRRVDCRLPEPVRDYNFSANGGVVHTLWRCAAIGSSLPEQLRLRLPPLSALRASHFLISSTGGGLTGPNLPRE